MKSELVAKGMLAKNRANVQLYMALLILAIGITVRLYHISYPHIATQDSGFLPAFAKNLAKYGLAENHFLPIRWYFADTGERMYHITHPPAFHNGLALSFRAFGFRESVYRLYNIFTGGILGVIFLYLLLSFKINRRVAIWALIFWAIIPSGAYFERMYSMNMQACTMITVMLYFFFRFSEKPSSVYRIMLILSCLLGALTDWHFNFVFPFLILCCWITQKNLRLSLAVTAFSSLITSTYLVYSVALTTGMSNYVTRKPIIGNVSTAVLKTWIEYARLKLEFFQIFTALYLEKVASRFELHFTEISWIIPLVWVWAVCREALSDKEIRFKVILPLLLISPGMVYIILVPHNTRGHIWTLYWFLPAMCTMFGITMDYLVRHRKPLGILFGGLLVATLFFFSVPTIHRLHGLSNYHVANVRAGQLISEFSNQARFVVADNYDVLGYYADMPVLEHGGRERITRDSIAGEHSKRRGKPSFVALNQVELNPDDILETLEEEMVRNGYHFWLNEPVKIWTNVRTEGLYLLTDQYMIPSEVGKDFRYKLKRCYFVTKNNLLRGFYHELSENKMGETILKDVYISEGNRNLQFSVLMESPSKQIHPVRYRVEIDDGSRRFVVVKDEHLSLPPRHFSIDISRFREKKVDIIFFSEADHVVGKIFFYWSEPRIVSEKFNPRKNFEVGPKPDIYRGEYFAQSLQPNFKQALAFWGIRI